ncbi:hypothetical protein Tco_1340743, partial [Tanacetum coccineum]
DGGMIVGWWMYAVVVMVVLAAVGQQPDGEGRRPRVRASEIVGWIDRLMRNGFGFIGKIQPEKFSGGGAAVVAGKVAGDGGGAVAG